LRRQARRAIVRIWDDADAIVGVGFLVGERQVVTCAHVAARALGLPDDVQKPEGARVAVDFPLLGGDSNRRFASVVAWSAARAEGGGDIAGLLLDHDPPSDAAPATLVTRDDLWGRRFRTFGFPGRRTGGDWATGILRDTQAEGWLQIEDDKQTGRRVQPGYSGAPIWVEDDLHGVVGMVVAADREPGDRVAYAIPAPLLAEVFGTAALSPSPYRGLSAFRTQDAAMFFGRDDVIARLRDAASGQPLVAVIGPSGSGKSSVVFAGLVAEVQRWEGWTNTQFHPGRAPFHALAASLVPLLEPHLTSAERLLEIPKLAQVLRQGRLDEVIDELCSRVGISHVLVVADQFEELYALCADERERDSFLDALIQTIARHGAAQGPALTLVLTMRADFLNQALLHRGFADALQGAIDVLGPMTREQLRSAIEEPARVHGVIFADGLVDRILDDVGEGSGRLPLLEFALTQLWLRQERRRLSYAAYQTVGGVRGALTQHAERIFAGLSASEQDGARRILSQLVMLSDGAAETRRVAYRSDLREEDWPIVQRLADERLVVTDRDEAEKERAQVTHEALIHGWDRLRAWVAADRAFLAWREQTRAAMRLWEANDHDKGALLRGALLVEAEHWQMERPGDIDHRVLSFLGASRAAEAQELLVRAENLAARGDSDGAVVAWEQGVAIFRELGDHQAEATALDWLAGLHVKQRQDVVWALRDYFPWGLLRSPRAELRHAEQAIACWERSAAIFRELGDHEAEAQMLGKLAEFYYRRWYSEQAIACWERSAAIFRELGDHQAEAQMLGELSWAYPRRGHFGRAFSSWARSKTANPNRHVRSILARYAALLGLIVWCFIILILLFVVFSFSLIWYLGVPSAVIANGLWFDDLVPLVTAVAAIALVVRTDGLRMRALIVFPIVASLLWIPIGSALTLVFWASNWPVRIAWTVLIAISSGVLLWFYRTRWSRKAQPYLCTLARLLRWFHEATVRSFRSIRAHTP
jgi:tetratricopeptide (TPR) repeat protein